MIFMNASNPVLVEGSRFCETLAMHGGFDLEHLGSKPMKPGLPFGSVPDGAGLPEAVVNW